MADVEQESIKHLGNFVQFIVHHLPKGEYQLLSKQAVYQAKRAVDNLLHIQGKSFNEIPNIDKTLHYAKNGSWTALAEFIDLKGFTSEYDSLTRTHGQFPGNDNTVPPTSRGSARDGPKPSSRRSSVRSVQEQERRGSHSRSSEDKKAVISKQEAEINELRQRLKSSSEDFAREQANPDPIENTPQQIVYRFRKIHGGEWKSALEDLLRKRPNAEKEMIILLSDMLKTIYEITMERAHRSRREISLKAYSIMLNPMGSNTEADIQHEVDKDVARTFDTFATNCLRSGAMVVVPIVQKEVHQRFSDLMKNFGVRKYLYECAKLTWLMNVQDPPFCLEWAKQGDRFLPDMYMEYTKRGSIVDYCAWPAMLIETGDIISKGVVQPK